MPATPKNTDRSSRGSVWEPTFACGKTSRTITTPVTNKVHHAQNLNTRLAFTEVSPSAHMNPSSSTRTMVDSESVWRRLRCIDDRFPAYLVRVPWHRTQLPLNR